MSFRGRSTETTIASSGSSNSQRGAKEKFSGPCEWHGRGSLRPCAPPIDPPPPPRRPRSPTASATGDSPGEQQRRAILFHGNATSAGSNAMFGRGRGMEVERRWKERVKWIAARKGFFGARNDLLYISLMNSLVIG